MPEQDQGLDNVRQEFESVKEHLNERVVGQEQAKEGVLRTLRRYMVGIRDENQPIGAFLGTGPTGVGKTELAKVVSNVMFDGNLVRFDMNEFGDPEAVSRLIGVPPGEEGSEAGGQLSRAVLGPNLEGPPQPCFLLFDEFEKAHEQIYDVFLRIFDEGEYQDQNGTLVDCTETVILLTSNAGQEVFMENIKSDMKSHVEVESDILDEVRQEEEKIQEAVEEEFPPEFINRLDEVLYFDPLTEDDLVGIMDIKFGDFKETVESQRDFEVEITDNAKKFIIEEVYDIRYGARPLERGVDRYIRDTLAEYLMENGPEDKLVFKEDNDDIIVVPGEETEDADTLNELDEMANEDELLDEVDDMFD